MRDYFTIYALSWGKEEHATTAKAALNKAIRMCARYDGAQKIFIVVDRGCCKTTSKVFHYGVVEATESGYRFTPDSERDHHENA